MDSTRPAADSPEVLARLGEAMKLVPFVVRQMRLHIAAYAREDDIVACANEGALRAARSFDPSQGVPFARWASVAMRGAVIDGLRRSGELPHRLHAQLRALEASLSVEQTFAEEDASAPSRTPEAADARLGEYLAAMATSLAAGTLFSHDWDELARMEDPRLRADEELETAELRAVVRAALGGLQEKERAIVEKHWVDGLTLEEAGASMGLSKSWSSRLHTRAIGHLTNSLKKRGLGA